MLISVNALRKDYTTYKKGHTFRDTIKSLFHREKVIVHAVRDISFSASSGELIGYLGPNGAGKSTTLKILTGILYPTSGEVSVAGFTPWKQRKRYVEHIGAVFGQKSQLIWDIPPADAFYMNKAIYGIPTRDFKKRLDEMVGMLDAGDLIVKPTRQLSLGERMKCEFVMAMLHNPRIIFLDEPTIGLDVIAKDKIREFILEQNRRGVTFILTTHDLDDIEHLARRVIVINHGEIVFDNTLNNLRKHLGLKKIVHLTTRKKLPPFREGGIRLLEGISDYEAELELNLEKVTLNQFIRGIDDHSTIIDMTVRELPIEHIIRDLYLQKTGEED
ncbi:MAG: ATP-binding cassette domain-containing protein [Spirochaetales bacterium]|nr:ATP-binding cassette domain-containing protein [Spirochaetales bacterium]